MMEVPRPEPTTVEPPRLRLLEGRSAALEGSAASLRAWITLFGALSFSGGYGVFLATALTRLSKVPGQAEVGQGLELAVVAWFVASVPGAFLAAGLRRRFLALGAGAAWTWASAVLGLTLAAFAWALGAIALS